MSPLFAVIALAGGLAAQTPGAPATPAAKAEPTAGTLRDAYQREFAFLAAQKKELDERRVAQSKRAEAEAAAVRNEIARLEQQVLDLDTRLGALRDNATRAEDDTRAVVDEGSIVDATLEQSTTTLTDYLTAEEAGKPRPEARTDALAASFALASTVLGRVATVRKESGDFFLAGGEKVSGELLRVGRVAAYGSSDQGAGPLAPAGGGRLKIWPGEGPNVAAELISGGHPDRIGIFLFESLTTAVEDDAEQTIYEHVASGGSIGWVIVVLGGLGFLLVLLRALILLRASAGTGAVVGPVMSAVEGLDLASAAASAKKAPGSAARVAEQLIEGLARGSDRMDELVEEPLLVEHRKLSRFGTVILVIAAVSPLLGLLGTVTGMISTFDIITKFGTGDPKMLSSGISIALVTTELGLIVAIPMLLLGNLLKGWSDRVESEVESLGLALLNRYEAGVRAKHAAQSRGSA